MSTAFARTTRALEADGFRGTLVTLLLVGALLAGWTAWFFLARVTRYEVSTTARLEVDAAVHPVAAEVRGRIVTRRLELDQAVEAGEVLVELDTAGAQLQLEEERRRLTALAPQLAAVGAEVAAEGRALAEAQQAARVAFDEARAQAREARAAAELATQEAARLERLHSSGIVADVELLRAQAEAERRQAAAESLELAVRRQEREHATRETERGAHIENLQREVTRLEGEQAAAAATVERLEHEIERRRLRAPVAGRVGEVANLQIGTVVSEGERLGAIIPTGSLRVVAAFDPPAVLGRIRAGQSARVRFQGFPWAEYGTVAATVSRVASEVRDGGVRVELAVHPDSSSLIPLQHGLPGRVEVEVERVAPAILVLRAAGELLERPRGVRRSAGAGEQ